jgi:hypothetical protein
MDNTQAMFLATTVFLVSCGGVPEPAAHDERPACKQRASLVGSWNVLGKRDTVTITKDDCRTIEGSLDAELLHSISGTYRSEDEIAAVVTRTDPTGCVAQLNATCTVLASDYILAQYESPGWGCSLAEAGEMEVWERE